MRLIPRLRHELARRPWVYWLSVALLAAVAAASTMAVIDRLERERASWGTTRRVLVTSLPVAPGDPLDGAVAPRSYPRAMVPTGALTELPPGSVARQRLDAGEVLVRHDVAATAAPRSLLEPGQVAVAVVEHVRTGARVGDRVTVVSEGIVLAERAMVVATVDPVVMVAVDARTAPNVAAATGTAGGISLLIEP